MPVVMVAEIAWVGWFWFVAISVASWLVAWLRVISLLISWWLNVVVGGMIPCHLFLFFFFGIFECSEFSFESCNLFSELLAWITFFWCFVDMGVASFNIVLRAHIVLEVNAKEWVQYSVVSARSDICSWCRSYRCWSRRS